MPRALVLFGPTASGKTAILKRLFIEEKLCQAVIISADSMQVYRGMDIGTAKPSPGERALLPHRLIDIRNPDEQFNAGDFARLAAGAVREAAGEGALPVVSGGTGFYLKNLVSGLPEAPPSDAGIREALRAELAAKGAAALMEELARSDPVSAGRIHINDEYRLLRALEVSRLTGKPLSSYGVNGKAPDAGGKTDAIEYLIVGLRRERGELNKRIDERTSAMFRAGLPDEVRGLARAGYTPDDPGLKAIGYREFFTQGPGGAWRFSPENPAIEALVAQHSRQYAKRQMTFFAKLPGVVWVDASEEESAVNAIAALLTRLLP